MRIVFMGSPEVAIPSLEYLLLSRYQVVAVVTPPDRPAGRGRSLVAPPVKRVALERGIPVLQPDNIGKPERTAELAEFKPDVIVICAFGQLLTQAVLDIPPLQCINVHFSLLPRHRGASPVAAAILSGDEFTGVSIQLVRVKLDTGPVLARAAVAISPFDTTASLSGKLARVGAHLLQETLAGWERGEITPEPQDESSATYFARIDKNEGEIDWQLPAANIWRQVRAYFPWPGSFTRWRGRKLKIIEASVIPEHGNARPGWVIDRGDEIGIGTGSGILEIKRLQLEGKRVMTPAEFRRGHRDFIGETLPS